MTAQERQAQAIQNMDASDDAYCRKRADSTVTYDQCRKNLMQLRQAEAASNAANAARTAAAVDGMATGMQQAGAYLQERLCGARALGIPSRAGGRASAVPQARHHPLHRLHSVHRPTV